MILSEERLKVGTRQVEGGRAKLRKRIVTESVSQTVPVSHEELTVTREPITDGEATGTELSEEEHEVVLRSEQAVVDKETVAVERVKLGKETVTEQETVTADVRKEKIELESDADAGGKTRR